MKKAKKRVSGTRKKTGAPRGVRRGKICDRYNGVDMCYRCLDLARSLLLCGDLHSDELKKIRRIMDDIISKKGVLKEDVVFLGNLSDTYLS